MSFKPGWRRSERAGQYQGSGVRRSRTKHQGVFGAALLAEVSREPDKHGEPAWALSSPAWSKFHRRAR